MSAIVTATDRLHRAPVAPRGWVMASARGAPHSETLPLETIIMRELANARIPAALAIQAGSGFGKTTALRHLASSLHDLPDVTWLDEPEQQFVDSMSRQTKLVFTAGPRQPLPCVRCTTLVLAPWRDDDLIEYLLARHRDRISSVMWRVRADQQRDQLDGSPMLWTIVLDAMAADDAIVDCATALCAHLDQLLDTDESLNAAGRFALLNLERNVKIRSCDKAFARVAHLIQHPFIRTLLAAERITWNLASAADAEDLALSLPINLLNIIAKRAANRPATLQRLQSIMLNSKESQHAMAASILVRAKPGWREVGTSPCLMNASLRGAEWSRLNLSGADLHNADLSDADLHDANFEDAIVARAQFHDAVLRAAKFTDAKAARASFAGADLRNARFDRADLNYARFDRANLSFASLRRAIMDACSLRGASLIRANLEGARLAGAVIGDADCYNADFSLAVLDHVDVSKVRDGRGMIFRRASLKHARLSNLKLRDADFVKANLDSADLTGSSFLGADLHGATLTNTGLARISWPNANLQGVDFTGASFHLGSSRSGLVGSTIPCEGSRTGFYTDEFHERDFKSPDEIRKANLCGAELIGAKVEGTDWYLVDLRGAKYSNSQRHVFERCGAILD